METIRGPFERIIVVGQALVWAILALSFAWKKRSELWVPPDQRSTVTTTSLIGSVLLAFIFIRYQHCSQIGQLLNLAAWSGGACMVALVGHRALVKYWNIYPGAQLPILKDLIIIGVYIAWSIGGTFALTCSSQATLIEADMKKNHQFEIVDPESVTLDSNKRIHTKANLPTYFGIRRDDCHLKFKWSLSPQNFGTLDEIGTYKAPSHVDQETRVIIRLDSFAHSWEEFRTTELIVDPEDPEIDRKTILGKDTTGHEGVLDVMVISKDHPWQYGSETEISGADSGSALVNRLARRAFGPYRYLVAMGTASREGQREREDGRANNRAEQLARWIKDSVELEKLSNKIYLVNLGQFAVNKSTAEVPIVNCRISLGALATPHPETACERRLIIIGVIPKDQGFNIETALRRAFNEHRNEELFHDIVDHYRENWQLIPVN